MVAVSLFFPFLSSLADIDLDLSLLLLWESFAHSGIRLSFFFDLEGLRARVPAPSSDSPSDLVSGSDETIIGDAAA